jgi:hypothetical protein
VIRLTVINDFSLRVACLALVGTALLGVAGCGNDRPMVPVSGRVTYDGGEWPMAGTIGFTPSSSADGKEARAGSGNFGKDGSFVVGSYKPGDGLLPGVYRVKVSCVDPSDFTKSVAELDIVPKDFHVEDLVVEAGMDPIELNLDVPKKESLQGN